MPEKAGDQQVSKVPSYKLTAEQTDFMKKFKALQKIRDLLDSKALMIRLDGEKLKQGYEVLNDAAAKLRAPENPIKDLEGMDFRIFY